MPVDAPQDHTLPDTHADGAKGGFHVGPVLDADPLRECHRFDDDLDIAEDVLLGVHIHLHLLQSNALADLRQRHRPDVAAVEQDDVLPPCADQPVADHRDVQFVQPVPPDVADVVGQIVGVDAP